MRPHLFAICLSVSCFTLPASAQTPPATPDVLNQLYKCKNLTDNTARLACYDASVGRVEQAQETGELVAIDRKAAKKIKRESFGFNIPSLPKIGFPSFGNDDATDDVDDVTVLNIKRTKKKARGDYYFYTDNGQIWEQVDGTGLRRAPRGDDHTLHIRKAAIGSFLAQVDGKGSGIRVRRIE